MNSWILSDLATALYRFLHSGHADAAIPVFGRENHTFANKSVLELARCQIGDEEHLLAYQLFWFIPLCDAADDGASVWCAVVSFARSVGIATDHKHG